MNASVAFNSNNFISSKIIRKEFSKMSQESEVFLAFYCLLLNIQQIYGIVLLLFFQLKRISRKEKMLCLR